MVLVRFLKKGDLWFFAFFLNLINLPICKLDNFLLKIRKIFNVSHQSRFAPDKLFAISQIKQKNPSTGTVRGRAPPKWQFQQKLSTKSAESIIHGVVVTAAAEYALESCELFGGRGRSEAKDAHRCYWHARPDIEMISSSTQLNGAKKERARAHHQKSSIVYACEHPSSLHRCGNYFYSSCQVVAASASQYFVRKRFFVCRLMLHWRRKMSVRFLSWLRRSVRIKCDGAKRRRRMNGVMKIAKKVIRSFIIGDQKFLTQTTTIKANYGAKF